MNNDAVISIDRFSCSVDDIFLNLEIVSKVSYVHTKFVGFIFLSKENETRLK